MAKRMSEAERLQVEAHQGMADRAAAGATAPNALDGGPTQTAGASPSGAPRSTPAPQGYDAAKWARGHASPKYMIADAIGGMDLSRGLTPEALDRLNALGIGTFTPEGQGGKVRLSGNIDPRFGGVDLIDLVEDAASGRGRFQYHIPGAGGGAASPDASRQALASLLQQRMPEPQDVRQLQPEGDRATRVDVTEGTPLAQGTLTAVPRVDEDRQALGLALRRRGGAR